MSVYDQDHDAAWTPTNKEGILLSLGLLLVYVIAMAVNLGVIWYECIVPDSHRTLINKVVALASLYKAVFATAFLLPICARLTILDHIWLPICRSHQFTVLSGLVLMFLAHNQLLFLRYVYTCRLSTVGAIKEDLIMALIWWLNLVFGGFFTVVAFCLTETGNNLYRFCIGNAANIADMPKEYQDMRLFVGLITVTAINHTVCGIKIWRKKRRICTLDKCNIKKKRTWSNKQLKDPSLMDHNSSCIFAFLNCMFAPAVGIFVGYLTGFPKVGMKAAMLTILVLVMPLSIYVRKPHIRTILARELKGFLSNL